MCKAAKYSNDDSFCLQKLVKVFKGADKLIKINYTNTSDMIKTIILMNR